VLGLAGAFEEAVEWIRKEIEGGKPLSTVMLSMPRFEDGESVVNKIFSFSPLIIGYADSEQSIELDQELILKVSWIAKNLGMKTIVSPPDIHILKDSEPVGIVRRNGYGASNPVLLKELARQIGDGKARQSASIGVKDSWIKSLKMLLGDRQARRMILSVILLIILPTIVVFYASLTYPFLFGGEMISFVMPIVVFLATTILTYLYLKK
jgi:hypothetical protein